MVNDRLVIHDGRHLPSDICPQTSIEIDAHLAFGTGTHETTRMMVSQLLDTPLENCRVLDCGTGTGILAIAALKLGASEAVGYDIDEWSADNALLADMEAFVEKMAPHSTLLLSGFYQQDIPMLEEKATSLGLTKKAQQHDGDWACLRFEKI